MADAQEGEERCIQHHIADREARRVVHLWEAADNTRARAQLK